MIEDQPEYEKVEFGEGDIDIFSTKTEAKRVEIKEPVRDKNISK